MPRKQKKQTKKQKAKKAEKERKKNEKDNEKNQINIKVYNKNNKDQNDNNSNKKLTKKERNAYRKKNKKNRKNDDIDEKFIKHLETLGYFIREVRGDGNCLFRSVSEQMEGNEHNYQHYRDLCIDYIKNNKDTFAPFIEDDEPIDKYIERMSEDKEWGGNLEIYALSMALEANFYIYIFEHPMYIVKNFEKPKKNITLTYHEGKHYNSLRKLEEKNKEEKEKEEKKKKEKENEEEEESEDNEEDEKDADDDINDLINKVDHLNI
jgi:OTU domain-containing protein 3